MMRARHSGRGFTLVELLVGTAIFAVVMTGIVALFVASIRAVKTSYQATDANEMARGVFNTVERDLTQGFTAREFGEYYQFHGTPMGYSMIGVVTAREQYNALGRVNFVIHPNPKLVPNPTTASELQAVAEFERTLPEIPGELTAYINDILSRVPSDDYTADHQLEQFVRFYFREPGQFDRFLSEDGTQLIFTASALRFVEVGPTNLDSYPFNWEALATDPEFGPVIGGAFADLSDDLCGGCDVNTDYDLLNDYGRELVDARRRTVYLDMLRGDRGLAFDLWDYLAALRGFDMNPEDYVMAERIEIARWDMETNTLTLAAPFFLYGNQRRIEGEQSPLPQEGLRLPTVWMPGPLEVKDLSVDWKHEWLTAGYLDPAAVTMATLYDPSNPPAGPADVQPNHLEPNFVETRVTTQARVPELVLVRLPLIFDSPYVGAPDYRRTISQTYDLSAGLARGGSG